MGKTYEYILDKEESIEKIRIAFSEEGHKIINETSLPYGIKFKCEDCASFILYFSKGRSSKIFFENSGILNEHSFLYCFMVWLSIPFINQFLSFLFVLLLVE